LRTDAVGQLVQCLPLLRHLTIGPMFVDAEENGMQELSPCPLTALDCDSVRLPLDRWSPGLTTLTVREMRISENTNVCLFALPPNLTSLALAKLSENLYGLTSTSLASMCGCVCLRVIEKRYPVQTFAMPPCTCAN